MRLVVPKLYSEERQGGSGRSSSFDVNPRASGSKTATTLHADPWTERRYSDRDARHAADARGPARKLRDR